VVDRRLSTALGHKPEVRHTVEPDLLGEERRSAAGRLDMGALKGSIGYHMRRAQIAIFHDIIHAFADEDIRPAQYSVLMLIGRNPGQNQSEIAAALGIKRTNFVALIDSLEARGLARRAATLADRRSYALYLTDAGSRLLEKLQRLQEEHDTRIVTRIGSHNRDALLRMLAQITALAGDDVIEE
jgi:DNA-binding MarR family transcriptional regulator